MKKAVIVMTVVLLAVCLAWIPVHAGSQKLPLNMRSTAPENYPFKSGQVIMNTPRGDAVNLVAQWIVKGLQKKTLYQAWVSFDGGTSWTDAGTATSSNSGNVNFHYNTLLASGTYSLIFAVNFDVSLGGLGILWTAPISLTVP